MGLRKGTINVICSRERGEIQLIGGCCPKCHSYSFPKREVCANCYHDQVNEVFLSRTGTVYSYTFMRVRPPKGFTVPYAIGYVLLDKEKIVVPALLIGSEDELASLAIGTAVQLAENRESHQADYVFTFASNVFKD